MHLQNDGNYGGIAPTAHAMVHLQGLEGFLADQDLVMRSLAALDDVMVHDSSGGGLQSPTFHAWDIFLIIWTLVDSDSIDS